MSETEDKRKKARKKAKTPKFAAHKRQPYPNQGYPKGAWLETHG